MTRQTPDRLVCDTDQYDLYPCLPLLPAGHPRWGQCRFGPGDSTANYRGHLSRWAIRNGHLFLESCGGYAATEDRFGRPIRPKEPRLQIGMIDIHEVDTPVPATWVSDDLVCPFYQSRSASFGDRIPDHFRLFRVERGLVIADLMHSNTQRLDEVYFLYHRPDRALLDAHLAKGGTSRSRMVAVPAAVKGFARALSTTAGGASRQKRADLLWQAGRADLDVLISSFGPAHDPDVRRWIAYALARIGPDAAAAIPELMRALPTVDQPDVVRAIAYALASIGAPASATFATVVQVAEVRCGASADPQISYFVERLRSAGETSIEALISGLLASRHTSVQLQIAYVLGHMGVAVVRPLCAAFQAAADDRRLASLARALSHVGREAGPALGLLLDRLETLKDDETRRIFGVAISAIGLRSPASLAPLRAAFRSARDERTLSQIAGAIASLGGGAVPILLEEFADASTPAKTAIAKALGEIGPAAAPAIACLASAAKASNDSDLVTQAAEALRKIEAPAKILATAQIAALRYASHGQWAEDVLKKMQSGVALPEEAVWDLVALLVETSESTSGRLMAKVLGAMGDAAIQPLRVALGAIKDQQQSLLVIHALGLIGASAAAALDDVVAALSAAGTDSMRLQLVDDLRRIGHPDEKHLATLIDVLRRASFLPVWWRLGLVLAEFGVPAIDPLIELLEQTQDDGRRRAIANALAHIGDTAAPAAPALQTALQATQDPQTRDILAIALRKTSMRLV